uniref:DDE-1 domain-containing protein n=1 Tax=Phytophthora ramorum TaxID=164328 RepID=H3GW38_PHYRM
MKKKKTRITLALTANADGSDTLPALFLGHAKQPYCLNKSTVAQLGFSYRSNKKSWMTGLLFREWLLDLDRDMRAKGRQILLLLDNASSHHWGDIVCTNARVEFLPPNTTAFLQPMDAGIIAAFKRAYRGKQLRWAYEKVKRGEELKKDVYTVDQLQTM